MSDVKKLVSTGFHLNDHSIRKEDLALVSLRIALKSFFETYAIFRGRIFTVASSAGKKKVDDHPLPYAESYAECIVHFQHFAELVCKHFLRLDHVLLADVAVEKYDILHKLLHRKKLDADDEAPVKSIEFSEALKRIKALVSKDQLKGSKGLKFFIKYNSALIELNNLRNRIWHRGLYTLDYPTLDVFIGEHILPFVAEVISHKEYKSKEHIWKYRPLECGADPFKEIINHFQSENYNLKKLCYLKELGRAAYSTERPFALMKDNPTGFTKIFTKRKITRAERIAEAEAKRNFHDVEACPVCGAKSLIIYDQTEIEHDLDDEPIDSYNYVYSIKCELCSLSLDSELGNASEFNLHKIKDYFSVTSHL